MSLLSVVQDVCTVVGVQMPTAVIPGITNNRTMQEMLALANEMAQRIAYDTRDWTRLRATVSYPGDGVTTAYNFPANYKRMLLTSNVWRSTSSHQPLMFVPDTDAWIIKRTRNSAAGAHGEWTMYGGQLHVWPATALGVSMFFTYLDKNCITLNGGGVGDAFTSDADVFMIDERLLKLGMTWQWKANKGTPYAEDMGTYSDALANLIGRDSPAPIILPSYRSVGTML